MQERSAKRALADRFDFHVARFALEPHLGLMLLPQRAAAGPEVAADENQQERQRKEIHHVDRVVDDRQKTRAHGDLGERQ